MNSQTPAASDSTGMTDETETSKDAKPLEETQVSDLIKVFTSLLERNEKIGIEETQTSEKPNASQGGKTLENTNTPQKKDTDTTGTPEGEDDTSKDPKTEATLEDTGVPEGKEDTLKDPKTEATLKEDATEDEANQEPGLPLLYSCARFNCRLCGKHFSRYDDHVIHRYVHRGTSLVKCPECGERRALPERVLDAELNTVLKRFHSVESHLQFHQRCRRKASAQTVGK